jgi:hypothetical protein
MKERIIGLLVLLTVVASAYVGFVAAQEAEVPEPPVTLAEDVLLAAPSPPLAPPSPEERVAGCTAAVEQALVRYECILDVSVIVSGKGNRPLVQILPKEVKP